MQPHYTAHSEKFKNIIFICTPLFLLSIGYELIMTWTQINDYQSTALVSNQIMIIGLFDIELSICISIFLILYVIQKISSKSKFKNYYEVARLILSLSFIVNWVIYLSVLIDIIQVFHNVTYFDNSLFKFFIILVTRAVIIIFLLMGTITEINSKYSPIDDWMLSYIENKIYLFNRRFPEYKFRIWKKTE